MAAGDQVGGVDVEDNINTAEDKSKHSESFTLEVLQIIKEAQQQHGLRHGDYQRYRQYCARRIRRIRKSLHFPQGSKHRVQPKKITMELLTDKRFLYLPLVDAERSWAYSVQLKGEANTEPRKRFHMISKLKKAVQHAELLSSLCASDKCDARTKLEAQAYCSWMRATLQFEMDKWKSAMEHYTSAKTIYEKLGGAFTDEIKEIYLQKCEEISPNIRYCAYNIGDESAIGDLMHMRLKTGVTDAMTTNLDELIEKTREKQAATLSEVTWRGRTVPIKNEHVRVFLLSEQESAKQLEEAETVESKLSVYESLLKELIDAQQALREELKDDPIFKLIVRGQEIEGKVPNAVFLHTYLAYLRLVKTVERNLLMIESLKANLPGGTHNDSKKVTKPQDLARLYDIIIQNLAEIPNLPGLEDDPTLANEIEAEISGYKAFRCFYMGQTYVAAKKWREAIALYDRVQVYVKEALDNYQDVNLKSDIKSKRIQGLQSLMQEVDGQKYSVQAYSILDTEDLTDSMATASLKKNKMLLDRIDEYYEDPSLTSKRPNLVHFPPDFQPIPCKPLFFDVALSKVEFPSLDDKLEQKKQVGGLTGYLTGWLPWGGKKK